MSLKIRNDDSTTETKNGKDDEMGKTIIYGTFNGERISMQGNSLISINDESQNIHHTAEKIDGETNTIYSDDSEEGDIIDDDESLSDSYYSGMI